MNNYYNVSYPNGIMLQNNYNEYINESIKNKNISNYSILTYRPKNIKYNLVPNSTSYIMKPVNKANSQSLNNNFTTSKYSQKTYNYKYNIPINNKNAINKSQYLNKNNNYIINNQNYNPFQLRNNENVLQHRPMKTDLNVKNTKNSFSLNNPQEMQYNFNNLDSNQNYFYSNNLNRSEANIFKNPSEENNYIDNNYFNSMTYTDEEIINKSDLNKNNKLEYNIPKTDNINLSYKEKIGINSLKGNYNNNFNFINGEIISNNNSKEYFRNTNGNMIHSYAYFEEQNIGARSYMEDKGKCVENFNGDPNKLLFCLFDGHGGVEVSKFLQENFHNYMKQILKFNNIFLYLPKLFKLIDEKIKELNVSGTGSTCTIVYIEKQNDKKILYCANIGDTRCVIVNRKGTLRLSCDDLLTDKNENERIKKQGGIIVNGRICGSLMVSRSFGDWNLKDYGVISTPHISRIEINDDDLFLVLASDGVWDMIKDEELEQFGKISANTLELCKNIVIEALNRGSGDNMSCFTIKFND